MDQDANENGGQRDSVEGHTVKAPKKIRSKEARSMAFRDCDLESLKWHNTRNLRAVSIMANK